jgi:diaminopimelate epimerase
MNRDISFLKMNGIGNEIVVVDLRDSRHIIAAEEAVAIASAPLSRFDQMMVLHAPQTPGTEALVRIYNADGGLAGACGNGMRCVAWVVSQATGKTDLSFETAAGVLAANVRGVDEITVDMGEPRFNWSEIPLRDKFHDTTGVELQIGPIEAPILHTPSVVNVGNPHAVFWVADPDAYNLALIGPMLENHPMFPERANISLAHVTSSVAISARTWERGAGLTRACGSAACAVAVCAARKGLTGRKVAVALPGGVLRIEWNSLNRILMTGPVEHEHTGVWSHGRAYRTDI